MVFTRDEASQLASAGSGYAIMQLVWPEESHRVAPEDAAAATSAPPPPAASGGGFDADGGGGSSSVAAVSSSLVPLGVSVVDYLLGRGVEWLLTRRLRDINLYHPEMTLDPDVLAYSLFLSELIGANMSVQVEYVDSVQAARASHSGVVLAPPRNRRATAPGVAQTASLAAAAAPQAAAKRGALMAAVRNSPVRLGSDVSSAVMAAAAAESGGGGGGVAGGAVHPHVVVDIKITDTATPRVTQVLNEARAKAKGRLAVSTRRYLWKLEVLKGECITTVLRLGTGARASLVQRPSVFRPSLEVAGDLAYLTFDMSDLTAATDLGARCVAVSCRHPARSLLSAADLEDLMGVIAAQANAKYAPVAWDRGEKLRVLMEVHHTSRPLLRFLCGRLMDARRDDKLYLGRGGSRDAPQHEQLTSRRLLSNFSDIAASFNVSAVKRPMEEPFEAGALKYAEHDRVNIVAIQAPAGRSVPTNILNVLKGARSAVLIYKSNETS
ncbi:hypothetical protein GPECTOR_3g274 [Gonium pectorale]|uniref:Uncharacterized protein n=1 Tax=Gonium pectorale TaxID=33097 RepID=A0A150GZH6_GONPE|nr:hypothetical protein GPECTOR_3g274 [Gonium pectorale]|eukprot:KXZ55122.1 hypothetical protein GPECTOR_3g274 [Gonium pectorale]